MSNSGEDGGNGVGRPSLSLDMYEVEYLRSLGFTWTDISRILDVSRSTLYRKIEGAGLNFQTYTMMSDTELDRVVSEIKADHPFIGEVMIAGNLRSRHIQVTRSRLRASIHRLDPFVHDNMKCAIRRRTYHVQSPNYIWHIDGNHKLIRWRIVVHGGIDGYSRVIVFLKPSTNNLAATMLSRFEGGVTDYGLPSRIRTDRGGENVAVWQYMMRQHNNTTSVIVGSSTHNERIERLWRDVHRCVLKPFADQFRHLETIGLLDPLNEVDIYCLHLCYLPRIEKCLNSFQEAWNNHCLSTEGNATPLQLFLTGLLLTSNDPAFIPTPPTNNCSGFPTSLDHVTVPRSHFMPCHLLCQELQERFDLLPTACNNYFDDGMYMSVVQFVGEHTSSCNSCSI